MFFGLLEVSEINFEYITFRLAMKLREFIEKKMPMTRYA